MKAKKAAVCDLSDPGNDRVYDLSLKGAWAIPQETSAPVSVSA